MSWMPQQKTLDLIEDVEFLLAWGEHPQRIAARLGTTVTAIEKALRTYGDRDHARLFAAEHKGRRAEQQRRPRPETRAIIGERHGERRNYRAGCRCDECTAANSEYTRRYRTTGVAA